MRRWLAVYAIALLLIAMLAPAVPQVAGYHDFADARTLLGIPHSMDVLSNLPFLFAALGIAMAMARVRRAHRAVPMPLWWHFAGLAAVGFAATACASGIYHLQPGDTGVLWDRMAMSLVFTAVVGLAVLQVADTRSAATAAATTLAAAAISLAWWRATGNFTPWSVLQGGGMLLVLAVALRRWRWPAAQGGRPPLAMLALLAWYALAKLCELADHTVFEATGHWISGHSLKHVFAALAAWPIIAMLYKTVPAQPARH
ncbi:hypothetical protein D8I35_16850 [Corticibacter populi]|uniref:Alkaline phytoceramidase n=1 Tax=Corticibacter populi TaxID=1550736 RepID=A0A3M6QLZ3_9BURK|nr:hypothetical protein D8I35_16850 [Corticibacter populi]